MQMIVMKNNSGRIIGSAAQAHEEPERLLAAAGD